MDKEVKCLDQSQIYELSKETIQYGVPVRFLHNGQCLDIITGELQPKNINIMYHKFYWHFSRETSRKIGKWLGVKAVFSG